MAPSRPLRLDDAALDAATARVLESRGFRCAPSPEAGRDAYDITAATREEVRLALETYLTALDPLPVETRELVDRMQDVVFSGRLGDWKEVEDLRTVIEGSEAIRVLDHREKARRLDPLPVAELSALVEERLKPLSTLYQTTRKEWVLEVHHILTEPTCPTATIRPEGSNSLRYAIHKDTVVEAILAAADLAHRELILGQEIVSPCPVTNPDDRK